MGCYVRPTSLDDALAALAARRLTVLAGATDHFPARLMPAPAEDLLDITALPALRRIERQEDGWRIPCLATWSDVIAADLPPLFDGLRHAARQVGGVQIQNVATLAGNVCNASPAADGIPCLLALDAEVELASLAGRRRMPIGDFVLGPRRTARRQDELMTGLHVPARAGGRGVFHKLGARRYLVISIAMVAVVAEFDAAGCVARAGVAVGACSARAERLPAAEAALRGRRPDPALLRPEHLAPLAPIDDVRAAASYRRKAALELLRRAVGGLAA